MTKKRARFTKEEDFERYQNNERERLRIKAKLDYDEKISQGKCKRCGKSCLMNFNTGKPFTQCVECRKKECDRRLRTDRNRIPDSLV